MAQYDHIPPEYHRQRWGGAVSRLALGSAVSLSLLAFSIYPALGMEDRSRTRATHPVSYVPQPLPWKRIPAHSILLKELRSGRILFEYEVGKRLSPQSHQDYVDADHP